LSYFLSKNIFKDVLFNYKFVGYNPISYPFYIYNILFPLFIHNMPTPFLDLTFPVYPCLNLELSNSFAFSTTPLVFCWHIKLIFLLVTTSTISICFHVRVPLFHVLKQVMLSWTKFFTQIRSQRCWDPSLYFTATKRWCIHSCSFNIVLELYNVFLIGTDLVFTLLIRGSCHRDSKYLNYIQVFKF